MKRLHLLLATAMLAVFLFSCKEEVPDIIKPDPAPADTTASTATLLTKTVQTTGSDVTTMRYQYDAQKRLAWYSNTSTQTGYFEDTSKIVRDANGIIQQIIYRSDTSERYNDPNLDSVIFNVSYNAAAQKYTHKISRYRSYQYSFRDSTVYTYGAQNLIVKEEAYYYDSIGTKTYILYAKNDYTHDTASNLTKLNTVYYKVDGVNDYPFEIIYTYDEKGVNLLNLGNEAIVLGLGKNFSAHAPKTMVSTYPLNPEYNQSLTYAYTFNNKYLPLTADITDAKGGAKSTLVYTYQ